MKYIFKILLTISILTCSSRAKNLGSHVHGSVHFDIATDKNQILVMLKSPAESFLGFEYRAKTKDEKMFVSKVKKDWKENLMTYLGKKNLSDCKISKSSWKQTFQGKLHSSISAESYIDCKNPVKGRVLNVSFNSSYPNIRSIHLQLLREDGSVLKKEYQKDFKIKL